MPYIMEDFERNFTRKHLQLLPPEERLKGLTLETILKQFPSEVIEASYQLLPSFPAVSSRRGRGWLKQLLDLT